MEKIAFQINHFISEWNLHSNDYCDLLIEDLLFRIIHFDQNFVKMPVDEFYSDNTKEYNYIRIKKDKYISLKKDSCGVCIDYHGNYLFQNYFYSHPLFHEIRKDYGYSNEKDYKNILSRINKNYNYDNRHFYSTRLGCTSVFIDNINDEELIMMKL